MALFTEPYSPKLFDEDKSMAKHEKKVNSFDKATESSPALVSSSARAEKLKNFVVDLKQPVFSTPRFPNDSQSDLLMFAPAKYTRTAFMHAIALLKKERSQSQLSQRTVSQDSLPSKAPTVGDTLASELVVYPGCNPLELYEEFLLLNDGQKAAIRKMLLAENYSLLLGLPGILEWRKDKSDL
jgi:hypothetical protein